MVYTIGATQTIFFEQSGERCDQCRTKYRATGSDGGAPADKIFMIGGRGYERLERYPFQFLSQTSLV